MYILVNKENIIVASSKGKPCEAQASANNLRVYDVVDEEYTPTMIGQVLTNFSTVEIT